MRRLEEVGFDESIEVISGVFEILGKLRGNKNLVEQAKDGDTGSRMASLASGLKLCKDELRGVLAALNGVDAKEYNPNMRTLLNDLNELINDPGIAPLLPSQIKRTFSGGASETTGDREG